jgi:hypothetical protein
MSQLIINKTRSKKGFLNRSVEQEYIISPFTLVLVLVVFAGFSSVVNLVSSNHSAMKGYEIKKLDDQRRELLELNEKRNNLLSELTSTNSLKSKSLIRRMVVPKNVNYVQGDTTIAMNE